MANEQHCDCVSSSHVACALLAVCLRHSACVNYDVLPMFAGSDDGIVLYERLPLGGSTWLVYASSDSVESVEQGNMGRTTMMNTDVLVAPRRREPA